MANVCTSGELTQVIGERLPGGNLDTLKEIETTLRVALGSDALFGLVNTRVVLRTGIDLSGFSPKDDRDASKVAVVLEALKTLGYSPSALQMVARKRKNT